MALTEQEAYNIVYDKIIRQGKPSFNDLSCAYRSRDNLRCGIGHLIPDEEYDPRIEKNSVHILEDKKILPKSLSHLNIDFLQDLQDCHDIAAFSPDRTYHASDEEFIEIFKQKMAKLAETYELEKFKD